MVDLALDQLHFQQQRLVVELLELPRQLVDRPDRGLVLAGEEVKLRQFGLDPEPEELAVALPRPRRALGAPMCVCVCVCVC